MHVFRLFSVVALQFFQSSIMKEHFHFEDNTKRKTIHAYSLEGLTYVTLKSKGTKLRSSNQFSTTSRSDATDFCVDCLCFFWVY